MANTDCPWEPPAAGTEAEHLVGALDRLRTTFRWQTAAARNVVLHSDAAARAAATDRARKKTARSRPRR